MNSLECVTARCLLGIYWWMGLVPLPLSSQLMWLLLALLVRCIWFAYYLKMLWIGVSYFWDDDGLSISYMSGTALFIGYSLLGLLIQVESALKHRTYERLDNLRVQLQLRMQRLGMSRGCRRAWSLLLLLGTQIGSDVARSWANAHYSISPVHIISLPQKWLLRLRYVQLLWQVMELNQRARQLRHSLLGLAAGNDLWQPYGSQEWQQLQTLRLSYDRIYECYEAFSDCYGWGMLGLQMMCGLEFVSNAYWIITEAYMSQRIYMLIYNGNTCFAMGTLVVALFWYGDASANNSRQIGCLIPKLVNPMGSKRYNDLVSEFLLQTLHQRFVVTAKDFFSLNLHLLSSMFAAVVTYLVILIQFMLAEKSSQATPRPEKMTSND
ncbi:gustatory receptor 23a-like [Drosophila montana]|uniref:gustatory receptor 23a n=1 Tax=Drosophila montana TaxID=40370 RepID=UPI00313E0E6B